MSEIQITRKDARLKFAEIFKNVTGEKVLIITSRFKKHDDAILMTNEYYESLIENRRIIRESQARSLPELELSKRLFKLQKMLSEVMLPNRKLNSAVISKEMGYETPCCFDHYQRGMKKIPFSDLRKLANLYGFNPKWLQSGAGLFYIKKNLNYNKHYEIQKYMHIKKFNRILCLKSDNELESVYTFIGDGKLHWEQIGRDFQLRKKVGFRVQNNINNFTQFINFFKSYNGLTVLKALKLSDSDWQKFRRGEIHPANFYFNKRDFLPLNWIDDLLIEKN